MAVVGVALRGSARLDLAPAYEGRRAELCGPRLRRPACNKSSMGGCMTWRAEDPEGYESSKIASLAVPYLQGKCLDLGCGLDVVWPSVIGVDNGDHFGERSAGIKCDVTNLSLFSSGSMDAVFSSHVLEHFEREDVPTILGEWWRVIRKGGFL